MELERYQIKFCSDQLLLQPDCPVHVKKLQCTRDNLTDSLILQIRYVNRSERTVVALVVNISLLDSCNNEVSAIHALPVPQLQAEPHTCFGDEKVVILPTECAHICVTVEQVQFSDGYLWRRKPASVPIPVSAPAKVCGKIQPSRHEGYWYCSCGLVNPDSAEFCGYCGKAVCAPLASVAAAVVPPAPPAHTPECYVFPSPPDDAPTYFSAFMAEPEHEAEDEFPVIDPPPTPAQSAHTPPHKKRHITVWVVVILLILGGIGAAGYFFGYPLYQYYQAGQLYNQGDYAQAAEIYQSLEDFDDAADLVTQCRFNMAYELLQSGDYDQAYQAAIALPEDARSHDLALTCLRKQFMAVQEADDYDLAGTYLVQANQILGKDEEQPAWIADAQPWMLYHEALAAYEDGDYTTAIELFGQCAYGDYSEKIDDCNYHLAQALWDAGALTAAAEKYEALGDYQNSRDLMYQVMQEYVLLHYNTTDTTTAGYLQKMVEDDVEGSQKMYDELYAWTVEFICNGATKPLESLDKLSIDYRVISGYPDDSTLTLKLEYTLPNGRTGSLIMAEYLSIGSHGTFLWSATGIADDTEGTLQLKVKENDTERVLYEQKVNISG